MASITEAFDSNVTLPCMHCCSLMCVFSSMGVGVGGGTRGWQGLWGGPTLGLCVLSQRLLHFSE